MAEMKTPGPDHPITVSFNPKRVRALYQGHVIADTAAALTLQEADYPAVQYFPRADVEMAFLTKTDRSTHCPYKGDASYFTILMDGEFAENSVWSYEAPYPAMTQIKEHLAFYPNKVEVYELDEPGVDVREVVEHTDDGAGRSQAEHWTANVSEPPADAAQVERPYRDTGSI